MIINNALLRTVSILIFFTGEHVKLSLGTEEVKVCLLEILVSCLLI